MIEMSGLANVDIADKLGFSQQTMVSMIRRGKIKMPVDRVEQFAKIIGTDPANLMRRVLAEDAPHVYSMLKNNGSDFYSKDEDAVVKAVREANPDTVKLPADLIEEIGALIKARVREIQKAAGGEPVRPKKNSLAGREARAKLTSDKS